MAKAKFNDGAYANMVTGMSDPMMDKTAHILANLTCSEDVAELSAMFANDGIAKRIANYVPRSALRHDIAIIGDEDGSRFKECSRRGLFKALVLAGTYARLYGGAIVVTLYDDRLPFDAPASKGSTIKGYKVFSSSRVNVTSAMFVTDSRSDYFDDMEFFEVEKPDSTIVRIHASRVTVVKGNPVPDSLTNATDRQLYFGLSEVGSVKQQLKDYGAAMNGVANMLQESDIGIFSLTGLNEMLSMPDCGIAKVQERMTLVRQGMSTMRAVFQDAADKYEIVSHNYAGIADMLNEMKAGLSAITGIPVSILFGRTQSGLAQTNQGDIDQYTETVESWRNDTLYVPMCKMISELVNRNMGGSGELEFEWGPVSVMSEGEKLEARLKQSQMMKNYYEMGVITSDEIRDAVFVNGGTFEVSVKE